MEETANIKYTLAHVGINCPNSQEAEKAASLFSAMFGWEVKNGEASVFAGSGVECLKQPGFGACGHIAIAVADVSAAVEDLTSRGFSVRKETAKYTSDGILRIIYLKEEICGFSVHLTKMP